MIVKVYLAALAFAASMSVAYANDADRDRDPGAVFIMTNSAVHNEVLSFSRAENGSLRATGRTATEGRGSGGTTDPLGSQGSLALSQDHKFLFAVNTGSGSVSSFRVHRDDLELVDVVHSGGGAPVAVAQWGELVYVLNFAGNSNVVGFQLSDDGHLTAIPNSIRYLSAANSGASSLAFTPDGKSLVVTEKLTNKIDVFPVQGNGELGTVVATADSEAGLFAIAITPSGVVLALEAGAGTLSSFALEPGNALTLVNFEPTLASASCWSAIAPNGRWVYTSNAGSSSISGFSVTASGVLSPLVAGSVVASLPTGSTNLDIAVSSDSKFLYSLNSGAGTIDTFKINSDGTLSTPTTISAFTPTSGFNGLAAY